MRGLILVLIFVTFLLLGNITAYLLSEEYRFFVKKIKYQDSIIQESIVIDDSIIVSRSKDISFSPEENSGIGKDDLNVGQQERVSLSALRFLESLERDVREEDIGEPKENISLDLSPQEKTLLRLLESYNLRLLENHSELLFAITPEYPDNFREWLSPDLTLYSFPTKTYREVYDIFEVLSYDIPIKLNIVNNFGEKSFFINLDENYQDNFVRIVFLYQNQAFGLKIEKSIYNNISDTLKVLR